jgi:hypothetical protein
MDTFGYMTLKKDDVFRAAESLAAEREKFRSAKDRKEIYLAAKEGRSPKGIESQYTVGEYLSYFGSQGWNLVSVDESYFYFKRLTHSEISKRLGEIARGQFHTGELLIDIKEAL